MKLPRPNIDGFLFFLVGVMVVKSKLTVSRLGLILKPKLIPKRQVLTQLYIGFSFLVKLQITLLKFEGVWILHVDVSKFEFYLLKFVSI